MGLDWFLLFVQIMIINIVLSGDNAVVIALASKNLPEHQRKKAIWWGAFGAIALRILLTVIVTSLFHVPYIQAIGAFLLFWIAIKLLKDEEAHQKPQVKGAATLSKAIWTIIVADFIMSLDNVLAISSAAEGNLPMIILGIGLSIPLIIWGSNVILHLLKRFPIIVYLGAGILGYTAGEMFVSDRMIRLFYIQSDFWLWFIPIFATCAVIVVGLCTKIINRTQVIDTSRKY